MHAKWLALIALCASASAVMAEGEFEIDQACVAVGCFPGDDPGFPVTLANNGAYRLTSNLVMDANFGTGIMITANRDVVLDLAGFAINGNGSCTGSPVTSCSGSSAIDGVYTLCAGRVVIRNGSVRGMTNAGLFFDVVGNGSAVEDVLLTENGNRGFSIRSSGRVVRLDRVRCMRNMGGCRIATSGTVLHVTRSEFAYNSGDGLALSTFGMVIDSTFIGNAGLGLISDSGTSPVAIGRNTFFGNNGGSANVQYGPFVARDMGGNVCEDGTCP